jgi:predicted GNAT superfamily acetyltransferase
MNTYKKRGGGYPKNAKIASEIASPEISIRHCRSLAEMQACVEVQRAVWGSADADLTPLPIFVVAAETGGQVLGAFADDRLVGFTMALAGLHGDKFSGLTASQTRRPARRESRRERVFLHSHMTAVLEPWRDRDIGLGLKLFQRKEALSRGIAHIEWTFDPLQIKNAYFNLVKLGAISRRYVANMYGIFSSPLQGGLPTDRLIADWDLNSARVRRALALKTGEKRPRRHARGKKLARVRVPAELAAMRQEKPEEALRMQSEIRQEFEYWLNRGYAATSVEVAGNGGEYLLEPWRESS